MLGSHPERPVLPAPLPPTLRRPEKPPPAGAGWRPLGLGWCTAEEPAWSPAVALGPAQEAAGKRTPVPLPQTLALYTWEEPGQMQVMVRVQENSVPPLAQSTFHKEVGIFLN